MLELDMILEQLAGAAANLNTERAIGFAAGVGFALGLAAGRALLRRAFGPREESPMVQLFRRELATDGWKSDSKHIWRVNGRQSMDIYKSGYIIIGGHGVDDTLSRRERRAIMKMAKAKRNELEANRLAELRAFALGSST